MQHFDTPIALFLFNRPEPTAEVFAQIAAIKPKKLLLIADGPRNDAERPRCDAARAVVAKVDWPCEVRTNFSDTNLGCKRRMASGLDWVFQHAERAIILEDDCVPDPTFFRYCEELLEHYADNQRVMSISGDNFQFGQSRTSDSYYFSSISHVWGWASWRRAWTHYDVTMQDWPVFRDSPRLSEIAGSDDAAASIAQAFEKVYRGEVDTWDAQWAFTIWQQNGLVILPDVNLISNIGFGADATHTRSSKSDMSRLPVQPMRFPLRHPTAIAANKEADAFTLGHHAKTKSA